MEPTNITDGHARIIDQNGADVGAAPSTNAKRSRFVEPSYTTLQISGGDWLRVKDRLTYGEKTRMATSGLTDMVMKRVPDPEADTRVGLDMSGFELGRVLAYVVEWSFEDARGRRIPVTLETVSALDPDTADEIKTALDEHVTDMEAGKNVLSIGSVSAQT